MHKAYTILISLELASIGIKCQGSNTNPFQQPSPIFFMFLASLFCHVVALQLASTANFSFLTTIIIFHFSGIVGCETLLWILLPDFWNWYIINLSLLAVTSLCYFNCIHNIPKLFLATLSTAAQPPNSEPQESQP